MSIVTKCRKVRVGSEARGSMENTLGRVNTGRNGRGSTDGTLPAVITQGWSTDVWGKPARVQVPPQPQHTLSSAADPQALRVFSLFCKLEKITGPALKPTLRAETTEGRSERPVTEAPGVRSLSLVLREQRRHRGEPRGNPPWISQGFLYLPFQVVTEKIKHKTTIHQTPSSSLNPFLLGSLKSPYQIEHVYSAGNKQTS